MTDKPMTAADLVHVEAEPERELVNVTTGEKLPLNVTNAAVALDAAREFKRRVDGVIRDAEEYLAEESRRQGTKTFHSGGWHVTLKGGESVDYDETQLMEALRAADCPEDRIIGPQGEAVFTAVTEYKLNRAVLRQLTAANPDYKAAAELAEVREQKRVTATVKPDR